MCEVCTLQGAFYHAVCAIRTWIMEKSIHSEEYVIFARRLKEARLAAGLKQTELAARLLKPHSYISRIENRQIRVDVIELRQICGAIGVSFRLFINSLEDELEMQKDRSNNAL